MKYVVLIMTIYEREIHLLYPPYEVRTGDTMV